MYLANFQKNTSSYGTITLCKSKECEYYFKWNYSTSDGKGDNCFVELSFIPLSTETVYTLHINKKDGSSGHYKGYAERKNESIFDPLFDNETQKKFMDSVKAAYIKF